MRNKIYTTEKSNRSSLVTIIAILVVITIIIAGAKDTIIKHFKEMIMPSNEEIQNLLTEALKKDHKIIINAILQAQEDERKAAQQAHDEYYKSHVNEIEKNAFSPFEGNENGNIVIVYFGDYNCKYCQIMGKNLKKIADSDPNVKIIYKNTPILGPESTYAAKVALTAYKLDKSKFAAINEKLSNSKMNPQQIDDFLTSLNFDLIKFHEAMKDKELDAEFIKNAKIMQEMHLNGTPSVIVNGKILHERNDEGLKKLINEAKKS